MVACRQDRERVRKGHTGDDATADGLVDLLPIFFGSFCAPVESVPSSTQENLRSDQTALDQSEIARARAREQLYSLYLEGQTDDEIFEGASL